MNNLLFWFLDAVLIVGLQLRRRGCRLETR
jgi:hypothetical protein